MVLLGGSRGHCFPACAPDQRQESASIVPLRAPTSLPPQPSLFLQTSLCQTAQLSPLCLQCLGILCYHREKPKVAQFPVPLLREQQTLCRINRPCASKQERTQALPRGLGQRYFCPALTTLFTSFSLRKLAVRSTF